MNPNPKIKAQQIWWNERMPELKRLVTVEGYRLTDLAEHYGFCVSTISSVLHNRKISLIGLRYNYAKELAE